ncbi:MAG: O-antigen ligase family protein, partial [Flammeovirgaceae bacterium]
MYIVMIFKAKGKLWMGVSASSIVLIILLASLYSFGTMKDKVNAMFNYKVNAYNSAFKLEGRLKQWDASISLIRKNLFLGVGIGDRKDELQKAYSDSGYSLGAANRYDSHNLFLDIVLTT